MTTIARIIDDLLDVESPSDRTPVMLNIAGRWTGVAAIHYNAENNVVLIDSEDLP